MKLEISTHHGNFRETVTLETVYVEPTASILRRLLMATAYHNTNPDPVNRARHVDRILDELNKQGWSHLGWSYIRLNDTPLPH